MSELQASSDGGYNFDDDGSLDDITDLPSWTPLPTGAYLMTITDGLERKEINKHPAFTVNLELKEIAELKSENLDEGEEPPKPGDSTGLAFLMDNEIGAGVFKQFAGPIAAHIGSSRFSDLRVKSKGLNILVALKRVAGKGDKADTNYNRIINLRVL
jgi:hypothetical protein